MLLRRFSKCSIPLKCYLFKTYCSNLYCASLWYNFTLTAMKKIEIAYNNSIRRLFFLPKHNSASEMYVNLNIMSFGELLRKMLTALDSDWELREIVLLITFIAPMFLYTLIYGLGGTLF